MVIAVDFDYTIHDNNNVPPGRKLGPPLPGAKEALVALHEKGHQIIIYTCRANDGPKAIKVVADWLAYFKIPYDVIWEAPKPICDWYVDDRAIGFRGNWTETLEQVNAN